MKNSEEKTIILSLIIIYIPITIAMFLITFLLYKGILKPTMDLGIFIILALSVFPRPKISKSYEKSNETAKNDKIKLDTKITCEE